MKRITRTLEMTVATVCYADVATKKFMEKDVELIGTFSSEKDCLNAIEREGDFVPLAIIATKRIVKRFAMPIPDFIKYAVEISASEEEDDEEDSASEDEDENA